MFGRYLVEWELVPDGEPIVTGSSRLLPVRRNGVAAMLKVPTIEEERLGCRLMVFWQGEGAARVLAYDEKAMLLERAAGSRRLESMDDAESARIMCRVAARLHELKQGPSSLVPLAERFRSLATMANDHPVLKRSWAEAKTLLTAPEEIVVLHGDLHHGNVLDFEAQGWKAIDPKGLIGERGYDFANLFCNPSSEVATSPGRVARLAGIVAKATRLEPRRLIRWVLAHAGLSAAWSLEDGGDPSTALAVAEIATAELSRV